MNAKAQESFISKFFKLGILDGSQGSCMGCGDCCVRYSGVLMVCQEDIDRWEEEKRSDLIELVSQRGDIWINRSTGVREKICPFLDRSQRFALCKIHNTKPKMCRDYPGFIQGYRCLAGIGRPFELDRAILW